MQHIARVALCTFLLASATRHAEPYIGSEAQLLHWLKTTDANLTFTGDPIPGITGPEGLTPPGHEGLTPRGALATTVVYCSVATPATARAPCDCPCNLYSHCGTRMDGGFCWTPGTNAIYVGGLFPG
ncbi:hypothetical protein GGF50DRAFT_131653 [Schizophyllum commune]